MRANRQRIFEILGAAETGDRTSLRCDIVLIALISLNVLATVLESVPAIGMAYSAAFHAFEAVSVVIFSVEYLLRLWTSVERVDPRFSHPLLGRLRYAVTPMAVIDLLAVLPYYAASLVAIDLRFLRVLRILRIFKLSHYFSALDVLLEVMRAERRAFGAAIFLLALGMIFAASGAYLFEHEAQPETFGSIPAAMWWALVTLTTVGYGDAVPMSVAGKLFGASITVMGIGMVALPTGILASGFSRELARRERVYDVEVRTALSDGIIDDDERVYLHQLREDLGLSEEDVDGIGMERRRPTPTEKCPHCGEALDA